MRLFFPVVVSVIDEPLVCDDFDRSGGEASADDSSREVVKSFCVSLAGEFLDDEVACSFYWHVCGLAAVTVHAAEVAAFFVDDMFCFFEFFPVVLVSDAEDFADVFCW